MASRRCLKPPGPAPGREVGDRGGQARPGVENLEPHESPLGAEPHLDASSPMLDRVRDQVADRLSQPRTLARHTYRFGRAIEPQRDSMGIGRGSPRLRRVDGQAGQVDRLAPQHSIWAMNRAQVVQGQLGPAQLELDGAEPPRGQDRTPDTELEPEPGRGEGTPKLVCGSRDRVEGARQPNVQQCRQPECSHRAAPPGKGQSSAHQLRLPSTNRYPTPHTLMMNRSPRVLSFLRSRCACESTVLVGHITLNPQTPRRTSSRVKTRVGSAASARRSANSFFDTATGSPETQTWREGGSISRLPTHSRPAWGRWRVRRRRAAIRARSSW